MAEGQLQWPWGAIASPLSRLDIGTADIVQELLIVGRKLADHNEIRRDPVLDRVELPPDRKSCVAGVPDVLDACVQALRDLFGKVLRRYRFLEVGPVRLMRRPDIDNSHNPSLTG